MSGRKSLKKTWLYTKSSPLWMGFLPNATLRVETRFLERWACDATPSHVLEILDGSASQCGFLEDELDLSLCISDCSDCADKEFEISSSILPSVLDKASVGSSVATTVEITAMLDLSVDTTSPPQRGKDSLWEKAVARAAFSARAYLQLHGPSRVGWPSRFPQQRQRAPRSTLRARWHTGSSAQKFECFRKHFWHTFGRSIETRLKAVLPAPISLSPTPLVAEVQTRFMSIRRHGRVLPAFHGTQVKNYPSIFARGLRVPGAASGIQVRNGSAHGVGVYAATVENPLLSSGFCRGDKSMLVCAVVSDAVAAKQPNQCGKLPVTAQSENVRHVGAAMVIFDDRRVAPLFVASGWQPPPAKLPKKTCNHSWSVKRIRFGVGKRS